MFLISFNQWFLTLFGIKNIKETLIYGKIFGVIFTKNILYVFDSKGRGGRGLAFTRLSDQ